MSAPKSGVNVRQQTASNGACRNIHLPRIEREPMRFLSADEIATLADAIGKHHRALVFTAGYTGLRWGELCGLRPERMNLLQRTVHVVEQLVEVRGDLSFGPPKTGAGRRSLTLPPFLVSMLEDQLARPVVVGSGLVFPSTEGTPLRRENFRRRWWVPATKRAGLQGLRFHDLRHTAVSLAIAAGSHPKQIQERLGHTSVTVTLDRYGHLFPTLGEQVADGLERAFRQSLADPVRTSGGPGVVVLPVAEGSHTL